MHIQKHFQYSSHARSSTPTAVLDSNKWKPMNRKIKKVYYILTPSMRCMLESEISNYAILYANTLYISSLLMLV